MKKFPDKIIREIADGITTGFVYYVNPETMEFEEMLNDDALDIYDLRLDEDENPDEKDTRPDWEKEMEVDIKKQFAQIDSWKKSVRIEQPSTYFSFKIMENFTRSLPEGTLKSRLWDALNQRKPFQNFKHVIDNSDYREEWFAFRLEELMDYVRDELGEGLEE